MRLPVVRSQLIRGGSDIAYAPNAFRQHGPNVDHVAHIMIVIAVDLTGSESEQVKPCARSGHLVQLGRVRRALIRPQVVVTVTDTSDLFAFIRARLIAVGARS